MRRKLTTKIQQITAPQIARGSSFSGVIHISADNEILMEKKGELYCVYALSANSDLDTELINKIIVDLLHDSYYQSDNISPIQSLEKSIVDVKDKVLKITNDPNSAFDIMVGALWGNVLYYVQYGKGNCYLVRDANVKNVNVNSEGKFSTASGIIKDEDVVIMATETFSQLYTPAKLLNTAVAIQNLMPESSCLILKFHVEINFSQDEVISFNPAKNVGVKKSAIKEHAYDFADKVKPIFSGVSGTVGATLNKLIGKIKASEQAKYIKPTIIGVIVVIAILWVGSWWMDRKPKTPTEQPVVENQLPQNTNDLAVPPTANTDTQPTEVKGAQIAADSDKTFRDKATVFYDLKIADQAAQPTQIALVGNRVVVADKSNGKIYVSLVDSPKFAATEKTYPNIHSIDNVEGNLRLLDDAGYKIVDLSTNDTTKTLTITGATTVANYLNYIYTVEGNKVVRYAESNGTLKPADWATSDEFENAKGMSIAISIYFSTADGRIIKYTKGEKDPYEIIGMQEKLTTPTKIVASNDFDNMYVLDPNGKRLVVLDYKGNFVKQIRYASDSDWNDLKDFCVDGKEKTAYVLDGSVVYKVSL